MGRRVDELMRDHAPGDMPSPQDFGAAFDADMQMASGSTDLPLWLRIIFAFAAVLLALCLYALSRAH